MCTQKHAVCNSLIICSYLGIILEIYFFDCILSIGNPVKSYIHDLQKRPSFAEDQFYSCLIYSILVYMVVCKQGERSI